MAVIKQNEPLDKYCTFRIGGVAKCLFFATNSDEIIAGIEAARENKFPFFVLGSGSNVLFSDAGFGGLVLKMENSNIEMQDQGDKAILSIGAGTLLANLVLFCRDNSLTGMEWASGIPGTVGGAIRGNAGAFHQEIGETVQEVQALEIFPASIEKKIFSKSECGFSYRESIFKNNKNLVIIEAKIILAKGNPEKIKVLIAEYLTKKATTQPLDYPSAGSVFMNPAGNFAAKIIQDCGFKGKIIGGAQVSEKHANFIINRANAKASDVKELIAQIKLAAKEKFNIDLREEIEIVDY